MEQLSASIIFEIVILILSLSFAGIFPKYFIHIYNVGHRNMGKSLTTGFAAFFVLGISAVFGGVVIAENRKTLALLLILLPILVITFSTGCALIAGILGIDGRKSRFFAITIVAGALIAAEYFTHLKLNFMYGGVMLYGLGASILAMLYPMEVTYPVEEDTGTGNNEERVERKNLDIDWDIEEKDDD